MLTFSCHARTLMHGKELPFYLFENRNGIHEITYTTGCGENKLVAPGVLLRNMARSMPFV